MLSIYVLLLENNKYYIGQTDHRNFKLDTHIDLDWTNTYKPTQIIEFITGCDDSDNDKYTIKYIKKYGVTNVRGGSFSAFELSENDIKIIQQITTKSEIKITEDNMLNKLYKWCGELSFDHYTLFLLDQTHNEYYEITKKKILTSIRESYKLTKDLNFYNFESAYISQRTDLIYSEHNYKIYIVSNKGFKRKERHYMYQSVKAYLKYEHYYDYIELREQQINNIEIEFSGTDYDKCKFYFTKLFMMTNKQFELLWISNLVPTSKRQEDIKYYVKGHDIYYIYKYNHNIYSRDTINKIKQMHYNVIFPTTDKKMSKFWFMKLYILTDDQFDKVWKWLGDGNDTQSFFLVHDTEISIYRGTQIQLIDTKYLYKRAGI